MLLSTLLMAKDEAGGSPSMSLVASSVASSFRAWLIKVGRSCSLSRALFHSTDIFVPIVI